MGKGGLWSSRDGGLLFKGSDVYDVFFLFLLFVFGKVVVGVLLFVADGVDGGVVEFLDVFGVVAVFLGLKAFGADGFVGRLLLDRRGISDGVEWNVGHDYFPLPARSVGWFWCALNSQHEPFMPLPVSFASGA